MRVGGIRQLMIPASMGYGAHGYPARTSRANAALKFEIELLGGQLMRPASWRVTCPLALAAGAARGTPAPEP